MMFKAVFTPNQANDYQPLYSYNVGNDSETWLESEVSVDKCNMSDIIKMISKHIATLPNADKLIDVSLHTSNNIVIIICGVPHSHNDPDYKAFESDGKIVRKWKLTNDNKLAVSESISAYLKIMLTKSKKSSGNCWMCRMEEWSR